MSQRFEAIVTDSGRGRFIVFPSLCKGCGLCLTICPQQTLAWTRELTAAGTPLPEPGHHDTQCVACKSCQIICPDCAVRIERL